jgi:hypothetical protein
MKTTNGARHAQLAIACAFLAFGLWCLFATQQVIDLAVHEPYRTGSPVAQLTVEALGCQAIAAGLFAGFYPFRSWTFPGFALSLLPIFVADWWLHAKAHVFRDGALLVHVAGLTVVLALCVQGFAAVRRHERTNEARA